MSKFIVCYLLTAVGLVGVFLTIDFFERVDEFFSRDIPISYLLLYYVYKIPNVIFYMAPQACLLATVITLATLARDNEFIAMKACGIGVTGITLPLVGVSLVIALLVVSCNEFIAPHTNREMNHIFYVKVRNAHYGEIQKNKIWLRSTDNAIWNIDLYDPEKKKMHGVRIFIGTDDSFIQKRIDANEATWDGNRWMFKDGYIRTFTPDGLDKTEHFEQNTFPLSEVPADFEKVRIQAEEMSLQELYESVTRQAAEGKDMTKPMVELHQKVSYPFIGIVLTLLAIPLSLRSSRRGGVMFCVAVNLGMGFVFSFLYSVGISLGYSGTFGPVLAAWGPNLLFIALGFYLILTLDSERILPV